MKNKVQLLFFPIILTIVFSLIIMQSLSAQIKNDQLFERGITHYPFSNMDFKSIGTAEPYEPEIMEKIELQDLILKSDAVKTESIDIDVYVPAGEYYSIDFDKDRKLINSTIPRLNDLFSTTVVQAINKAPKWMENDLINIFSLLKTEFQQKWANTILEAQDPYVDEIAFSIAHLSPQYLQSSFAYPEMIKMNAELIYENDKYLDYVRVVDYGSSQTNENYYSTTIYKRIEALDTLESEVPRDIYYWYVVHPKITSEIPAFIDPDALEYDTLYYSPRWNNITTPDKGYFWRDYLFNHADPEYPKMKDLLGKCDIVWSKYSSGIKGQAIHYLNTWQDRSLEFTSDRERPHQPIRIYAKHKGRCGEYSDMRIAAARTALIPCKGVASYSTDHVWNEFWDERWIHWDGVIDNPLLYVNNWGKEFGSVFDIRSDGLMNSVTSTYTRETSKITIYALDSLRNPMDGAEIILYAVGLYSPIAFDNYGITDNEGKVTFIVGANRDYWASMKTQYGRVPKDQGEVREVAYNTVDGEEYRAKLILKIPRYNPEKTGSETPQFTDSKYMLEINYLSQKQILVGKSPFDDLAENGLMFDEKESNINDNFILSETEYENFTSGKPFTSFGAAPNTNTKVQFEFTGDSDWHYVFNNSNSDRTLQHITATATLYKYYSSEIKSLTLLQNYPNPLSPQKGNTTIAYKLPQKSNVTIVIYDVLGRKIKTLVNDVRYASTYTTSWDGKDVYGQNVPTGVYFYHLKTDYDEVSNKILVVK
ncbi:MAG: transglutaminase domain-containing protein [Bacteroidota bacterium]